MEGLRKQAYRAKMRELGKTLRHRIAIQKRSVTRDQWGNQVEEWQDWQTVWANLQTLWGERYYAAKAVGEENTVIFELRRAPFLEGLIFNLADYRIVETHITRGEMGIGFVGINQPVLVEGTPTTHFGRVYTIKRVDQLPGDTWIKLTCEESGGNG
jgi:hypothetical protein